MYKPGIRVGWKCMCSETALPL